MIVPPFICQVDFIFDFTTAFPVARYKNWQSSIQPQDKMAMLEQGEYTLFNPNGARVVSYVLAHCIISAANMITKDIRTDPVNHIKHMHIEIFEKAAELAGQFEADQDKEFEKHLSHTIGLLISPNSMKGTHEVKLQFGNIVKDGRDKFIIGMRADTVELRMSDLTQPAFFVFLLPFIAAIHLVSTADKVFITEHHEIMDEVFVDWIKKHE